MTTKPRRSMLTLALRYHAAGLCIIPIRTDGTKAPTISWASYQYLPSTEMELAKWFDGRQIGLAAVCGIVSNNLEVLDVDEPELVEPLLELIRDAGGSELLGRLPQVETPSGGRHIPYRCVEIEKNQKLASRPKVDTKGNPTPETLVETRGQNGYVLLPGSPPACHPTGRTYRMIQGDWTAVPEITVVERELLLTAARSFDEMPATQEDEPECPAANDGGRPGDKYAARVSWAELLTPASWKLFHSRSGQSYWQRPGKEGPGISATTGYKGADVLHVFTTNAHPFEPGKNYTKFAVYTILHHGGDFKAAARDLAMQGYGERKLALPKSTKPARSLTQVEILDVQKASPRAEREPGDGQSEEDLEQRSIIESLPDFITRVSQLPELKEYVPDIAYQDQTALCHGHPRDGKTIFELELGLTASIGGCVLGLERFRVTEPFPVCYVSEEDSERETMQRITWLLRGKGISKPPENFFIAVRRGINLDEGKWLKYLTKFAKEREIRLMTIDPLRSFTARADQGPSELKPIGDFFRRFMTETDGCSPRVVHHDTKPQAGKTEERARPHRASGGGIFSISDCPLSFSRIGKDKTLVVPSGYKFSEDPAPFKFTFERNKGAKTEWIRLRGETLDSTANDADLEKFEAILEALKKKPGLSGRGVSDATGIRKDDVNSLLAKLLDLDKVDTVKKGNANLWFLRGS